MANRSGDLANPVEHKQQCHKFRDENQICQPRNVTCFAQCTHTSSASRPDCTQSNHKIGSDFIYSCAALVVGCGQFEFEWKRRHSEVTVQIMCLQFLPFSIVFFYIICTCLFAEVWNTRTYCCKTDACNDALATAQPTALLPAIVAATLCTAFTIFGRRQ